jgi:SAM-dependent methyltransferase
MNRKEFIRDVYSRYWITAREKIYVNLPYDQNLVSYIKDRIPPGADLLEVAVGTGEPFGRLFVEAGYQVAGIDISPALVARCKELHPGINCRVGDAEDMEVPDGQFTGTYCFHSTWYFPDLEKAIREMIRVTRPGGLVLFDIMNLDHPRIRSYHERKVSETRGVRRVYRFAKNVAKLLLGRVPYWPNIVYETPTRPGAVICWLRSMGCGSFALMGRQTDDGLVGLDPSSLSFAGYERLVFSVPR